MSGWVSPGGPPGPDQPPPSAQHGLPYRPRPTHRTCNPLPVLISGGVALLAVSTFLMIAAFRGLQLPEPWTPEYRDLEHPPRPGLWLGSAGLALLGLVCWIVGLNRRHDVRPPLAWTGLALMLAPFAIWLIV